MKANRFQVLLNKEANWPTSLLECPYFILPIMKLYQQN